MRLWILVLLLFAALPCAAATEKAVLVYYWEESSPKDLAIDTPAFNQISTDNFSVTADGTVNGDTPPEAVAFAHAHKMPVYATVSNFGASDFDPKIAHAILTSPAITEKFLARMLLIIADGKYSGLNVDFEAILPSDRALLTNFLKTVAKEIHARGLILVVSVPAEPKDDPTDSWNGAFHYSDIAPLVDVMQIMTYDEHGTWGEPGPVAGLDWMTACIHYAATIVPPAKISLGLPAYGYDWNLTRKTSASIHWSDIPPLIASSQATMKWDAATSSPFFHYIDPKGNRHVVWYENATSIALKTKLVPTYKLAGVSVWALGMADASFWQAIRAGF